MDKSNPPNTFIVKIIQLSKLGTQFTFQTIKSFGWLEVTRLRR